MLRRHIQSLYFKVVIPIVALVLTGMGLVSFFAMKAMSEGVRHVAAQRAHYEVVSIREAVEDLGNWNRVDRDHLQASLDRRTLSPDVDVARILATNGKVLYSSRPAEVGQAMAVHLSAASLTTDSEDAVPATAGQSDVVHASGRIMNQPHCASCHTTAPAVLALVDVDISLSRQSAGMRTWSTLATTATVAQFMLIGLGIALILGLVVVRPVKRLAESMSQVQHGNLEVTAVGSGTGEIDELVGGFNDMVTRLRQARQVEQDAQRSHLARVEQLATLGEVAASLAHEIRNPLAGSKAAIDVLAGEEGGEESRRILRHVSEELGRVDGVVRQLLNFAKPKAPVLANVDLRSLLDDAVMLSGPRAAAQGATLQLQSHSEPIEVLADSDMVLQVVVNLLINGLHAVQSVPDATVTLSLSVLDGQAACSLRDNGPGVPADQAAAIFRPFVTTKRQGTGLGLATSRRLIELHGGQLWLENPGEPGACFTFTLPLFARDEQAGA